MSIIQSVVVKEMPGRTEYTLTGDFVVGAKVYQFPTGRRIDTLKPTLYKDQNGRVFNPHDRTLLDPKDYSPKMQALLRELQN